MNKRIKKKKMKQALEKLVNKIKEATNKVQPMRLYKINIGGDVNECTTEI